VTAYRTPVFFALPAPGGFEEWCLVNGYFVVSYKSIEELMAFAGDTKRPDYPIKNPGTRRGLLAAMVPTAARGAPSARRSPPVSG
jgi:hypothetical protein